MTEHDIESMHALAPVINDLPGEPVPYYLASGEGQRYEIDGRLYTVIARGADTGGQFDAAYILGPRGTAAEFHSLPAAQRSYVVMDGSVQFWLPGQSRVLVPGDSVHVPPGTPVAYRMLSELSRVLLFSAPSGAVDALIGDSAPTTRHVYSSSAIATAHDLPATGAADGFDDGLPGGADGYFLRSRAGDRRGWPDAVNSYIARGRNTGSRYIAVNTLAAPQPYIIRHFHRQHTENFVCLTGRIWLWVNGTEVLLTAGDFLHAPAGTIHSFAIAAHNTQMLGLLTTDVFEPFFDVTGVPTDDLVYSEGLIDPTTVIQGIQTNPDLDLVVVGAPPERVRAPGL